MAFSLISILDPNTRRRLRRFVAIKRAKWSLYLLLAIFIISLLSNFIANDKPLLVKHPGGLAIPVFFFYPESEFVEDGAGTEANYKNLSNSALFDGKSANWMLWPPIPFGPRESLPQDKIGLNAPLTIEIQPELKLASIDMDPDFVIRRSRGAAPFFAVTSDRELIGRKISETLALPDEAEETLRRHFANQASPAAEFATEDGYLLSIPEYKERSRARSLASISLIEPPREGQALELKLLPNDPFPSKLRLAGNDLPAEILESLKERAVASQETIQPPLTFSTPVGNFRATFDKELVKFPFRPVRGHVFGLDDTGRDVGVRILYATRLALLFGLILVLVTYTVGIIIGALQGFFAGKVDMFGQRFIEIWEALPFLFIMIFVSDVYGRGFGILLLVYGVFNWIGISYYMRAEFLKLRSFPFVESAKVMGINRLRIMFSHILPNALVPVITFFPFALVGAIGSLTALDYLGFGLPAGSPSWGDLLSQGQTYPYAWWLILYPSIALFIVSLLGIFIGEGIRAAFDPKNSAHLE